MSHDPLRRDLKRVKVAVEALTAMDPPPVYRRRVFDLLEGATALQNDLRRDAGDAPSARERRSGG